MGRARHRLGHRDKAAGQNPRQQSRQGRGSQRAEALFKLACGFGGADDHAGSAVDRAGIQSGLQCHDADARLRITGQDGSLDRGRAAPAGQQGGVHIDAAATGKCQYRPGQQQAVGHDDDQVG